MTADSFASWENFLFFGKFWRKASSSVIEEDIYWIPNCASSLKNVRLMHLDPHIGSHIKCFTYFN